MASVLVGAVFALLVAYSLGRLCLRHLPAPRAMVLAVGAPLLSLAVFLLLLAGVAGPISFLLAGAATLAPWRFVRRKHEVEALALSRTVLIALVPCGAAYGILYLVHAMAPEVQPDAVAYHLGLTGEWMRIGGFADRIGFYDIIPLGAETLFAFAYAYGGGPAAKLVHLAFLAATAALMLSVARRLRLPSWTGAVGAMLYCLAPVCGVTATSAYNDAALAFSGLAVFYALLSWKQDGDTRWLWVAGLVSGYCYAIKMSGLVVPVAGFLVVAALARRLRPSLAFGAASLIGIAPWMGRALALTGNPFAPLLNGWFPNPYFYAETERLLAETLRTYHGMAMANLPFQLTAEGDILQGILGPVFLLSPLALVALRTKSGRLLLAAALVLAAPWVLNLGTRFLMPSLPFLSLALAMSLPRSGALAVAVLHAVLSWPGVIALYDHPATWRLRGFPIQAAAGIESDTGYLRRELPMYPVAEMVNAHAQPQEYFLDLAGAPWAYLHSIPVVPWQSEVGNRIRAALELAAASDAGALWEMRAEWPEQPLAALRVRNTLASADSWSIHELRILRGSDAPGPKRVWALDASANYWHAPLAMDRNPVSRWTTWEPAVPGMYFEIDFGGAIAIKGVELTAPEWPEMEIDGRAPDGAWRRLAPFTGRPLPALNLRRYATRLMRAEGIRYVLTPAGLTGYGPLGKALVERKRDWGMEEEGTAGDFYLLRIRQDGP